MSDKTIDLKGIKVYPGFDWKEYVRLNSDLKRVGLDTEEKAITHWLLYGHKEGRIYSRRKGPKVDFKEIMKYPEFDWKKYVWLNPDLKEAGVDTKEKAISHWLLYGRREGRVYSQPSEAKVDMGEIKEYPGFDWKEYVSLNLDLKEAGVDTQEKAVAHWLLYGRKEKRIYRSKFLGEVTISTLSSKGARGSAIMVVICPEFLVWELVFVDKGEDSGRPQVSLRLSGKKSGWSLPQGEKSRLIFLGDVMPLDVRTRLFSELDICYRSMQLRRLDRLDLELDPQFYVLAAIAVFGVAESSLSKMEHAIPCAVDWLRYAHKLDLGANFIRTLKDAFLHRFFATWIAKTKALGLSGELMRAHSLRKEMLSILRKAFESAYQVSQRLEGRASGRVLNHPRSNKLVLLGSQSLPQCYYYRVKQKLGQAEQCGLLVDNIDISELAGLQWQSRLMDAGMVIVCRQPATFEHLRFIYYTKSLGIPVLYDIDDLTFNEVYFPGSFESYAGTIDKSTYIHLNLDNSLFREALVSCDGVIVTTKPLAFQVRQVISKDIPVWIHRNSMGEELIALSSSVSDRSLKTDRIRIFYGSGTKANKQVFYDVLVPALVRILKKHENVEVHLIGHFELPDELARFSDRILMGQVSYDYAGYLQQLKRADINVAILEKTTFVDCKSEIKWLEAAALGIPSVLTPTKTYTGILHDGQEALFASTIAQWVEAFSRLIRSASLRERIGKKAYSLALSDYGPLSAQKSIKQIWDYHVPALSSKRRKRILVTNVFFAPQSIGGATRIAEAQVQNLVKLYAKEFDIFVLCSDCHPQARHPYEVEQYSWEGVLVTKIYSPSIDWNTHTDEKILIYCREFYAKYEFDLIHFHCVQVLTASVVLAAQELRIPYVVTVHDGWWLSRNQFLVNEDSKLVELYDVSANQDERRIYLLHCLRQARAVLAVSEPFSRIYKQAGLSNVIVNENGVDPFKPEVRRPSPSGKVRIAHLGHRQFHKGFHLFRKALEEGQFENLEGLVIDGGIKPGVVVEEVWGSTRVIIKKDVLQSEIASLYSGIDVLVAPSVWPESYGLVTREAKIAGVWVIASDRGAIGADVIEGVDGNIIPVDDHTALVKVLGEIDKNKDFYLNYRGVKDAKPVRRLVDQTVELVGVYNNILKRTL